MFFLFLFFYPFLYDTYAVFSYIYFWDIRNIITACALSRTMDCQMPSTATELLVYRPVTLLKIAA